METPLPARTSSPGSYVVGYFTTGNPTSAISDFGFDPSYRLNLTMEVETATALQGILDHGPSRWHVYSLQSTEGTKRHVLYQIQGPVEVRWHARSQDSDPFPFLFDGRSMAKGPKPPFARLLPLLAAGNLLAVETNISTFNMTTTAGTTWTLFPWWWWPFSSSGESQTTRRGLNKSQKE